MGHLVERLVGDHPQVGIAVHRRDTCPHDDRLELRGEPLEAPEHLEWSDHVEGCQARVEDEGNHLRLRCFCCHGGVAPFRQWLVRHRAAVGVLQSSTARTRSGRAASASSICFCCCADSGERAPEPLPLQSIPPNGG